MLKKIEEVKVKLEIHKEGLYTVYVLIANVGYIGSGVFYVGGTNNVVARLAAHKSNPEKIAAGGKFVLLPVYVGLSLVGAIAMDQGLMRALSATILINKIRGLAQNKVAPKHWFLGITSYLGDIAENEWLNWLKM